MIVVLFGDLHKCFMNSLETFLSPQGSILLPTYIYPYCTKVGTEQDKQSMAL